MIFLKQKSDYVIPLKLSRGSSVKFNKYLLTPYVYQVPYQMLETQRLKLFYRV